MATVTNFSKLISECDEMDALMMGACALCVINFAADRMSIAAFLIRGPFIRTNVRWHAVLLDARAAKKASKRFVQVSTDEVMGAWTQRRIFAETTAAALQLAVSGVARPAPTWSLMPQTFGLECSNTLFEQLRPISVPGKLIPLMMIKAMRDERCRFKATV